MASDATSEALPSGRWRLQRRSDGSIALMGHVIADFPSAGAVRAMIEVLARLKVDVIEIQVPFSEPMADGPVFLRANHEALKLGVDWSACLRLMGEVSRRYPDIDFVFMSYLNPLFQRGYGRYATDAAAAGARGVIVPDLPFEEATPLREALAGACKQALIPLVAPNTPDDRLQRIFRKGDPLVYAVARAGVTGGGTSFDHALRHFIERVRRVSAAPVGVGFGVRSAADVRVLRSLADVAIVGTASLVAWEDGGLGAFERLWASLAEAAK